MELELKNILFFLTQGWEFNVRDFHINIGYGTVFLIVFIIYISNKNIKIYGENLDTGNFRYKICVFVSLIFLMLSLVIHEFSHSLVAYLFGIKTVAAGLSFWGTYVETVDKTKGVHKLAPILISFAGPLVNILIGNLALRLSSMISGEFSLSTTFFISETNLGFGIFNLLPIGAMTDGGQMLWYILHIFVSEKVALITLLLVTMSSFFFLYLLISSRKGVKDER